MNTLKIAVQKSDRISKGFLDLLSKCGLTIEGNKSKLYCRFQQFPIELYFVRGSDIPSLLKEKFDVAIIGKDTFLEYDLGNISYIKKELGFAKCRLSFAGIAEKPLNGQTIATSYTNILKDYLTKNNIDANVVEMNGSVESSIQLGIADFIFDIVQTGSTLLEHGLIELRKVLELEAVMVAKNALKSDILDKLIFRINAVLNGKPCKYVMFNLKKALVDKITSVLPSGKSPTILDLVDSKYCAIHTLCGENEVWDICEELQRNGAENILVSNVDLRFL